MFPNNVSLEHRGIKHVNKTLVRKALEIWKFLCHKNYDYNLKPCMVTTTLFDFKSFSELGRSIMKSANNITNQSSSLEQAIVRILRDEICVLVESCIVADTICILKTIPRIFINLWVHT